MPNRPIEYQDDSILLPIPRIPSITLLGDMKKPSIFLWKYRPSNRNYPGYHLTADNEGIDLIGSKLSEPQHPLKKKLSLSIDLKIPTDNEYSVPNCPSRPVPFTEWVIDLNLKSDLEVSNQPSPTPATQARLASADSL